MNGERLNLETELRALAEEAAQRLGAHLMPEELMTYCRGQMSAEARQRVQNHVAVCQDCVGLLLDLETFNALAQESERGLTAAAVTDLWREMQPKLHAGEKESGSVLVPQQDFAEPAQTKPSGPADRWQHVEVVPKSAWWERFSTLFSSHRLAYAMAASFLILSVGLGAWVVLLGREYQQQMAQMSEQLTQSEQAMASARKSLEEAQQRVEEASRRSEQYEAQIAKLQGDLNELSQPQLNVPVEDLRPREFIRGKEAWKTIEIPPGANLFTLILAVSRQPSYAGYEMEIQHQRGRVVWRGAGLQKNATGSFTLALPRRLVPPGQYQIRIYGLGVGQKRLVEEYAVQIRHR